MAELMRVQVYPIALNQFHYLTDAVIAESFAFVPAG